jgi:hypothetical protein
MFGRYEMDPAATLRLSVTFLEDTTALTLVYLLDGPDHVVHEIL